MFVNAAISAFAGVRSPPSQIMPLRSHMIISPAPIESKSLAIATPAAPEPLKTTVQSESCFLTIFNALTTAARQTTAVPC